MLRPLRDADARTDGDLHRHVGGPGAQLERRAVERKAVVLLHDPERLAEPPGSRAEEPEVVNAAPSPHLGEPNGRLERADQHGAGAALRLADEVEAPVNAVGTVDIG